MSYEESRDQSQLTREGYLLWFYHDHIASDAGPLPTTRDLRPASLTEASFRTSRLLGPRVKALGHDTPRTFLFYTQHGDVIVRFNITSRLVAPSSLSLLPLQVDTKTSDNLTGNTRRTASQHR